MRGNSGVDNRPSWREVPGIVAFWSILLGLLYWFTGLNGIIIVVLAVGGIWWFASSYIRRQKRRRAALGIDDYAHARLQRHQPVELTVDGRTVIAAVDATGKLFLTPKSPIIAPQVPENN